MRRSTAVDGADAWEKICSEHFDLLITDHTMPRLSGASLVKKVRAAHIRLPMIMASGTYLAPEHGDTTDLNLDCVLMKPFTPGQLLEKVHQILDHKELGPEQPASTEEVMVAPSFGHWGIND